VARAADPYSLGRLQPHPARARARTTHGSTDGGGLWLVAQAAALRLGGGEGGGGEGGGLGGGGEGGGDGGGKGGGGLSGRTSGLTAV